MLRTSSRTGFRNFVATLFCLINIVPVIAEVIHIPVGKQAPELRDLSRPVRGMSQDAVLAQYGEPISLSPPVGHPPISKWMYENFTVYFESSVVIHSVLIHRPKHPELIPEDIHE